MSLFDESYSISCPKCDKEIKPLFPLWSDYVGDEIIGCNHCFSVFEIDIDLNDGTASLVPVSNI